MYLTVIQLKNKNKKTLFSLPCGLEMVKGTFSKNGFLFMVQNS